SRSKTRASKNRSSSMLAKILKRRRDRRNLDYSLLMAEPDPVFGRLDGRDPTGFVPGLSPSGGLGPDDLAMDGQLPLERADGKPLYYAGLEGFPPTAWRCTACGEL